MIDTPTKRWILRPERSNWGDFGPDDQIGKMNLLTPAVRLAASREIEVGQSFCLSLPLDMPGGNALFAHRRPPRLHAGHRDSSVNYNYSLEQLSPEFTDIVCDDAVTLYTQYSTQWDALGHMGQNFDLEGNGEPRKTYYNGYIAERDIVAPSGDEAEPRAKALGIENLAATCVQGRGVLVNLKARYGASYHAVGYEDLMSVMASQNVVTREGDLLCLYTGTADLIMEMGGKPDTHRLKNSCAALDGRDDRLLDWIDRSGIVAICSDNIAVEVAPSRRGAGSHYSGFPLHEHCLFKLGVHLAELWYFKELSDWLTEHHRNSFFLTAPPLRLPGAVGSPVTPVATV